MDRQRVCPTDKKDVDPPMDLIQVYPTGLSLIVEQLTCCFSTEVTNGHDRSPVMEKHNEHEHDRYGENPN